MADWHKTTLSDLLMRRRAEEAPPEPDAVELSQMRASEEKTPFWRRRLGGRRSDSEVEEAFEVEAPAAERKPWFSRPRREDDAGVAEPVDETSAEPKTPFWKRNRGVGDAPDEVEEGLPVEAPAAEKKAWFSFRRRGDSVDPDLVAEGEQEPAVADERRPFWKRDVSLRRSAGAVEEDAGVEAPLAETKPRFSFRRRGDGVDGDRGVAEPAEEPTFGHESLLEGDHSWRAAEDDGAEALAEEPGSALRRREDVADAGDPVAEPIRETASFSPDDLSLARSAGEGERRADASRFEPVTAEAEDEPFTADEATPFWKRNLSFGRRADALDEEPEMEASVARTRRFAFRRRDDSPDGGLQAVERDEAPSAGEEKTPFWKRNLSLGRSAEEDGGVEAPAGERKPRFSRWRREASVNGDHGSGDSERRPFYRRELRLPFVGAGTDGALKSDGARGGKKQQLVGLKIGASQIAAARIANDGSPELLQAARQAIEPGIVVGGELRDPDALADALRDFFATHDLPNRGVRLGIGNNRIGVRSLEITGVQDPSQLENAIRFRAQEALPIPLDEAVLDYQVIDESVSPTGMRTYRVLLVVAYRELIDRYVAACRGAGLRLAGIDLEAFALLRALLPPASENLPEDTALVAVSIGHDRSTFAVSNGTVCEFTRVLDWGGAALNTAIARALDITPSQAEPVKRNLALRGADDGGSNAATDDHSARAEAAVRLELQSFARELVSSLHFYQNQPGSLAIGSIVLTGGTAHMPGLAAELQRLTGVKVRVGDPLRRVRGGKRVEAPDQLGSFAVAIGLGIED